MVAKVRPRRKGSQTGFDRPRRISKTNRFDPAIYAAISAIARQERRSTSNLIESLMAARIAKSAFS